MIAASDKLWFILRGIRVMGDVEVIKSVLVFASLGLFGTERTHHTLHRHWMGPWGGKVYIARGRDFYVSFSTW